MKNLGTNRNIWVRNGNFEKLGYEMVIVRHDKRRLFQVVLQFTILSIVTRHKKNKDK